MGKRYQIASLQDFAVQPETVQLPSQKGTDKAVLLKKPDMVSLIMGEYGEIPDLLTGMLMAGAQGAKVEVSLNDKDKLPQIAQMLNAVAIATFIEPRVCSGKEPQDDALPVSWLPFDDRVFVMNWAMGTELPAMQKFREEQSGGVGTVSEGGDVPPVTESNAAD